jgi:hypothetical protein
MAAAMTPEQQTLVRTSFAKVAPIADQAAILFYDDLFERNPRLRSWFKEDMTEQQQKLMTMLGTAVANPRHWDQVERFFALLPDRAIRRGVFRSVAASSAPSRPISTPPMPIPSRSDGPRAPTTASLPSNASVCAPSPLVRKMTGTSESGRKHRKWGFAIRLSFVPTLILPRNAPATRRNHQR